MRKKTLSKKSQFKIFFWQYKILIILALIIVLAFSWLFFKYYKAQLEIKGLINQQEIKVDNKKELSLEEKQKILDKMKKIILLPDEEPVIATIFDSEHMKEQDPFFAQAENGDQVVFFVKARKVFIYRLEQNMIINAGPIYVDDSQGNEKNNHSVEKKSQLSIEIRNGGAEVGEAGKLAKKLKEAGFRVDKVTDANLGNYHGINLINLNNKNIDQLKKELGTVNLLTSLPEGEKMTKAQVLVIIGG